MAIEVAPKSQKTLAKKKKNFPRRFYFTSLSYLTNPNFMYTLHLHWRKKCPLFEGRGIEAAEENRILSQRLLRQELRMEPVWFRAHSSASASQGQFLQACAHMLSRQQWSWAAVLYDTSWISDWSSQRSASPPTLVLSLFYLVFL